MTKERIETIIEIAKRAEDLDLLMFERISLLMDLEIADKEFNLRLNDLLNTDDFNFAHDIVGIQRHIDRRERKMDTSFLPRFAGLE